MMVYFMCQLDWAMGYLNKRLFLGISIRVFQIRLAFKLVDLLKIDCPSQCGWAPSKH